MIQLWVSQLAIQLILGHVTLEEVVSAPPYSVLQLPHEASVLIPSRELQASPRQQTQAEGKREAKLDVIARIVIAASQSFILMQMQYAVQYLTNLLHPYPCRRHGCHVSRVFCCQDRASLISGLDKTIKISPTLQGTH